MALGDVRRPSICACRSFHDVMAVSTCVWSATKLTTEAKGVSSSSLASVTEPSERAW